MPTAVKPKTTSFISSPVNTEETVPLTVSCMSNGSRPAATIQLTIGQTDVTLYSTTDKTHVTDDDTYTLISTLTYNVDRIYNGENITCNAVNIVVPNGVQTSTSLDVKFDQSVDVRNVTYEQDDVNRRVACFPIGNYSIYTYHKWQHKSKFGVLIRELDGKQSGVLTLPSIPVEDRYQDSGEYICTVGNGIANRDGNVKQTGSGHVKINEPLPIDISTKDYESLGKKDKPNVYEGLNKQTRSTLDYESLGKKRQTNVYEDLKNKQDTKEEE